MGRENAYPAGSLAEFIQETVREARQAAEGCGVSVKKVTISTKVDARDLGHAAIFYDYVCGKKPVFPRVKIEMV